MVLKSRLEIDQLFFHKESLFFLLHKLWIFNNMKPYADLLKTSSTKKERFKKITLIENLKLQ